MFRSFQLFYRFLNRYRLNHLLFWIGYGSFWVAVSDNNAELEQRIANTSVLLTFHAAAAYFNIYVLVPLLLNKKQYAAYIVSLFLTVLLICFPIAYFIYRLNETHVHKDAVWEFRFFFITFISATYTVIILMISKLFFQWYEKEKATRELERINTETELKFLKSQINPHFLFNSLNNLYALSLKKADETPDLILKLADMLRYLLYECSEKKVLLEREVDYLQNYIDLERVRQGNRSELSLTIIAEDLHYFIEPMLLVPFVENGIKHGLNHRIEHAFLKIRLEIVQNQLFFTVVNNKSRSKEVYTKNDSGGIGLLNVKKRLAMLYPGKHELELEDGEDTYTVSLKIDLT